jgi:L-2,4-diaminobutyrate decarboxylase
VNPDAALATSASLRPLLTVALDALAAGTRARGGPVPPAGPDLVLHRMEAAFGNPLLPDCGTGAAEALSALTEALAWGAADPRDPRCAAHLHCPPLALAVAADLVVSALNPSLDSWDQAPSGVAVEAAVVRQLATLAGLPPESGGSITSGATESNLMGVLLARELAGRDLAVLCSEAAHFSVRHAARVAGLPDDAVTAVAVDAGDRMDLAALDTTLAGLGKRPVLVAATAGTTDLGAVDPLDGIAALVHRRGGWFHVDAAYGGGALFSDRLRPLLAGLEQADSLALDLHKLGWQPVPAGVFLTRDPRHLDPLHRRAAYLNPADDEDAGYRGRLAQSLRTTRRPDAFSIAVTMRALGRKGFGDLVDRCHALAGHAAARLRADARFELAAEPTLTSVVFRYRAGDDVNAALRRDLLDAGVAVVGRTERHGRTWLKLTLLNPHTSSAEVDALLDSVADAGSRRTAPQEVVA